MSRRRRTSPPGSGVALAFGVSALASIGLTIVYAFGGQPQLEGVLLGIALGGLAVGLIRWAQDLMPGGGYVEQRDTEMGGTVQSEAAVRLFERGEQEVQRRSFLGKALGAALGALGLAALFPIRSLGSAPGTSLVVTPWTDGIRAVTVDGEPVRADDLEVGGVLTVFPDGHPDAADAQTLLIHLAPGEYRPVEPNRADWAPEDFVAFSKVCTHAGCPVGLYQPADHRLFCPCHQSIFDVLDAAAPTAGPATRPLPQLPLRIDTEGYIAAAGDYSEPIGPGYWSRPRA